MVIILISLFLFYFSPFVLLKKIYKSLIIITINLVCPHENIFISLVTHKYISPIIKLWIFIYKERRSMLHHKKFTELFLGYIVQIVVYNTSTIETT